MDKTWQLNNNSNNKREQINANELYSLAFTPQGDFFVVGADSYSAVVPR